MKYNVKINFPRTRINGRAGQADEDPEIQLERCSLSSSRLSLATA